MDSIVGFAVLSLKGYVMVAGVRLRTVLQQRNTGYALFIGAFWRRDYRMLIMR